ncbi:putative F-box protein At5g55150 [Hordeum vulgare subsp. vulgare]|uniref:F-box domain-containing protein n=1 Tax=Hordeum vulgare subsp. vulgare TaxID=112509 RepID=A0A8I7B4U4_HORVV|nr:putative F-box protein At5g55150 [Hordeum vulgare subsp. vulgare]
MKSGGTPENNRTITEAPYLPPPALALCKSSKIDFAYTEACSLAWTMSLWSLAIHPAYLCSLVLRALPRLLRLTPGSLKKSCKHPLPIKTTEGASPDLPQDILMGIFATLEIPDLVRAGSVCSSWRSASSSLRSLGHYTRPQTPCLLYTSESAGESVACLYSLAEKRTYKLTLPGPPIRNRHLIGSSQGLLVTVDDRSEMHLVNPLTGEQIDLPPVITMEHVKPIYNDSGALHEYEYSYHSGMMVYASPSILALGELRNTHHHKAFVFSDKCNGYIVVLIHGPFCQLSFARAGDNSWRWLPPCTHYDDCIYKNGLLYAVTSFGEIHTFDLSSPFVTTKTIVPACKYEERFLNSYIVQAPWGNLLQVWRLYEHCDLEPEPGAFVFWNTGEVIIDEFDASGKEIEKISCLCDHVLFLGHNQSLCLTAEDYPALKGKHAYFTDDSVLWTKGFKNNPRDMGILNLGNNSREEVLSPELWSNCPAPVWITPNLRKMNLAFNE